ncbi:GTP-binding protein REM 1-like [Gigantopelta aegis]|uniref:GTP-binding protein REM 1-like n=1 Tax=Gigantopelta aegis TaxID=1735272 RepID=UPI001B8893D9|nr:GTP-binding protein REM 1-like [Gigantopelta aegis]
MHHMQAIVRLLSNEYRPIVPPPQEGRGSEAMNSKATKTKGPENEKQLLACRILVLGDSWVGKSAIIHQFLKRDLPADKTRTVQSHEEKLTHKKAELTLSILEFGGNGSILRDWNIARADAFVLVYSLLDESSFETVRSLRNRICKVKNEEEGNIPVMVVANKTDLYQKEQVSVWRTVAELSTCLDWKWAHAEVSAVTEDKAVVDVFQNVLSQVEIDFSLAAAMKPKSETRLFSLFRGLSQYKILPTPPAAYIAVDSVVETGVSLSDDAIVQIVSDVSNDIPSDDYEDDTGGKTADVVKKCEAKQGLSVAIRYFEENPSVGFEHHHSLWNAVRAVEHYNSRHVQTSIMDFVVRK